jgi:predicted phosphodiesterase
MGVVPPPSARTPKHTASLFAPQWSPHGGQDVGEEGGGGKKIANGLPTSGLSSPTHSHATQQAPKPSEQEQKSIKFQIASDLHLEHFGKDSEIDMFSDDMLAKGLDVDILCLLGDICTPSTERYMKLYEKFLLQQAERFTHVFVVAGNHEYYMNEFNVNPMTVAEINAKIQALCDRHESLHFLNRKSMVVDGVRFVGCVLWTEIPPAYRVKIARGINDYHYVFTEKDEKSEDLLDDFQLHMFKDRPEVRMITPEDTTAWHYDDLVWLQAQFEEARAQGQRVVVLTHHPPTAQGTSNPIFYNSPLRHAFQNNLEEVMEEHNDVIKVWGSGHTHWSCNQSIEDILVVSNQFGYQGSSESTYDPMFTITV